MPFPSPMRGNEVAQSCPTLRNPMDCSLPGSSVRGIFQARVLEWGAVAFSLHSPSFPHSSVGKDSTSNAGYPSSIPGSGRSSGEGIGYPLRYSWASLVAQLVKNLPAMQETWVQSLGLKDPLEKGMATHSSTLAWKIPWTEEPGRLQSMESHRVRHD